MWTFSPHKDINRQLLERLGKLLLFADHCSCPGLSATGIHVPSDRQPLFVSPWLSQANTTVLMPSNGQKIVNKPA
jgi:hypothetical protein